MYETLAIGNSEVMKRIAVDTKKESNAVQKDARSMKVLTFIAMLYLPASLVAVRISVTFLA
jgi:hypothetical protein